MHRISSRYHVPKGRPSKRKMQALLKAKKRWASGEIELEHQSLHVKMTLMKVVMCPLKVVMCPLCPPLTH
ncbi:hypothetical protein TNCT_432371 [Trichonephila clavata]|uniref:Uncharacterized protein n=1 Tax=Trichonephila clavata TaxID=2740835 RepID=A0A8X6KAL7_TRICU|nr:hypothetical protein TNCT_432371 [Trichonephila clavata]